MSEQSESGAEQKTWCPNCHEKGTVSDDCFSARCPTCGEQFDPRDYGPENYDERSADTDTDH